MIRSRLRIAADKRRKLAFGGGRNPLLSGRGAWPAAIALGVVLGGCGAEPPKKSADAEKTAAPVPEEFADAAKALLGSEAEALLYGDLAKTGKKQVLAANVLPNTPRSTVAGTVLTRAVIAEFDDGKWVELFRCDEYLKNPHGFLGLTPRQAVTGWKLQYEDSPEKGVTLYFTPVRAGSSERTLPIAVKWNPEAKRYQSMDPSYQHFLNEAPALDNARSILR
ncbi:MAG TPA: hypothetical protein VF758_05495 [Candidatus Acidoferrum sp.]